MEVAGRVRVTINELHSVASEAIHVWPSTGHQISPAQNVRMTDTIRESLQAVLGTEYVVVRELGGGGMSRVWVARDERLGRDVVVKVLSPSLAQEFSLERFAREIRLAATLQHAHIVPLLTAGATADGLPFYLMPFVEGESLRARLERPEFARGLPIDEVVLILKDVSRALAYAHARGVVHRDIKPDNIMLSGGAAVVADFGIAKAVSSAREAAVQPDSAANDSLTRMGTSLGTPSYMAPEQGAGDPGTDHRADVYALGATAYELLTGETPFGPRPPHALLVAHFTEVPTPIETRRADVPAALAELVMACLAKDPDARPQTAAALGAALGGVLAAETSQALASTPNATAGFAKGAAASGPHAEPTRRTNGRRNLVLAAVTMAVVVTGAFAARRFLALSPGLDANRIAVMPFNVRENGLQVWREGLVDVLSRNLDGAGALRTVAPSTVISQSPIRADAASALTLGTAVGAGLVVVGDLSGLGGDSVRLRAAIYDVARANVKFEIDLRGEGSRMDALADSLSFRILREVGGGGSARLYSVGTRSLPALKAFLQGQQFYRRASLDSARAAYLGALELDSTFALAWRGVAALYIRRGQESDPSAQRALDMAIRYKSGRSPRDSMLLRADSLRLALVRRIPGPTDALATVPMLAPLIETLQQATRNYPSDAELWFELGDAAFHFGALGEVPDASSLEWFERGTAIDSTFAVSAYHSYQLTVRDGRASEASRHAKRVAATYEGPQGAYFRLLAAILEAQPLSTRAQTLWDSVPAVFTAPLLAELATMPDTGATAVGLARAIAKQFPTLPSAADSANLREALVMAFSARGLFREAMPYITGQLSPALFWQLARLGAIAPDSATANVRQWALDAPRRALGGARLLSEQRDTASLMRLIAWTDSLARTTSAEQAAPILGSVAVLRAYRTLALGDSAAALREFLAVPMAACGGAPCAGGTIAQLLAKTGRTGDALRVLARALPSASTSVSVPLELLFRARLAEQSGNSARALADWSRVITLWKGGDAGVQAAVTEARNGLQRLQGR